MLEFPAAERLRFCLFVIHNKQVIDKLEFAGFSGYANSLFRKLFPLVQERMLSLKLQLEIALSHPSVKHGNHPS